MRRFMLGIAFAITSFMPAIGLADDQQIADFIKSRLQAHQQQGKLRGFNVDMTVDRGVVRFKGHVSNSDQESLILQTAQQAGHLGVSKVVDDIEVVGGLSSLPRAPQMAETGQLQAASYQQPSQQSSVNQPPVPMMQQSPMQQSPMQQSPMQQSPMQQSPMQQSPMQRESGMVPARSAGYGRPQDLVVDQVAPMPMAFAETTMRGPAFDASCPPGYGGAMPMGHAGGGGFESPNLPGYAWPGYAAHPNYGQVAYPKQYSPSAWPYIGPFYPYPQVPLGWRKVSLQWDDGWWWLDFHDKCGSR